ncbi:AraC family transcriptional regulator [Paenibacillus sp. GCM10027626]|uniref:AraC family transcriptional regulator n=1 Tax=Paenibacillus sp. GCM10027626 TaxID=3273411 RepID=UPI00362D130C
MSSEKPDGWAGQLSLPEQFECRVDIGALRFHVWLDYGFFHTECVSHVLKHNHAAYEIQLVHKGTIILSTEDGYYAVPEGSLCFIPIGLYHGQQHPGAGEEAIHKSCLSFRLDALHRPNLDDEAVDTEEIRSALTNAPFFIVHDCHEMIVQLAAIKRELHAKPVGYLAKVKGLLTQIIVDVIRASPQLQAAPRWTVRHQEGADSRLLIIEAFFSEHFHCSLKESDLARLLYVSPRQLNRILHDLYGMSFRRKLLQTRMEVAMDLLKHTNLPVKEIAARVGYLFSENFHAYFKAHTGMTPVAFRQSADMKAFQLAGR